MKKEEYSTCKFRSNIRKNNVQQSLQETIAEAKCRSYAGILNMHNAPFCPNQTRYFPTQKTASLNTVICKARSEIRIKFSKF